MIRPDTPPGTEVICIDAAPGKYGPSQLTLGGLYTVKKIVQGENGFCVQLHEVPVRYHYEIGGRCMALGYMLSRFRYIDPQVENWARAAEKGRANVVA